jgi:hypothetical protein
MFHNVIAAGGTCFVIGEPNSPAARLKHASTSGFEIFANNPISPNLPGIV